MFIFQLMSFIFNLNNWYKSCIHKPTNVICASLCSCWFCFTTTLTLPSPIKINEIGQEMSYSIKLSDSIGLLMFWQPLLF